MEVTAKLSNLRTAPRKVRLVADLVRGKKVPEAQAKLSFTINKSSTSILKLINSAVASAKHNHQLDENNLYISKITVDEGPKLKRWHPMSRGRAYQILKRSSHIALVLKEINPTVAKAENPEIKNIEKSTKKEVNPVRGQKTSGETQKSKASNGVKTKKVTKKTK